jgi:NLI interacting factor-like phosphatase
MKKEELPIIFIIDIDNTLIGKSQSLLKFKELSNFIRDSCNRNKIDNKDDICKITEKIWEEKVNEKFFRPYMKEFFMGIKETYKNAEFFVFSTGISTYVKRMVGYIEKHLENKIKINKPYFSREKSFRDENLYHIKDINVYDMEIIKALKKKYPKIETKISEVLNERTIIIDDLEVWDDDYRHIKIKGYMYDPIIEFDYFLLKKIYENQYLYNYVYNSEILEIERGESFNEFLFNYHLYMMNLYKKVETDNKTEINDNQFEKLLKLIVKLKNKKGNIFTKKNLTNISKKMISSI